MPTITGIATGDSNFSILVSTLQYLDTTLGTNLVSTLDTPGADLTVFAPTNAAFATLAGDLGYAGDPADNAAVTSFLVANVAAPTLLSIVQYHVSPGTQLSGDVAAAGSIATLNGATITPDLPTLVDNEPDLIDPSLVSVDNIADNGVVHVIDRVLLPVDLPGNDAPTITGIVASSGTGFDTNGDDFDMLLKAVTTAGLQGVLDDTTQDLTAFAPKDSAFVGLSQALGYSGSDESGAWDYLVEALTLLGGGDPLPLLTQVLTYHVAGESLQASQVLGSSGIATLQGGTLGVSGASLVDADPDVADPNIVKTDIQAANGVVHVLDGVLLPADLLASDGANDVDFIIGSDSAEKFKTGADADFVDANGGNDRVWAGKGNDTVLAGTGDDWVAGGSGDDNLQGDAGHDTLFGGSGKDMMSGGDGNDWLFTGRHDDKATGGEGDDVIFGFGGNDMLSGDAGNDFILGGWGKDMLSGGDGHDELIGGSHDDTLNGGDGNDVHFGGGGSDTFVFSKGDDKDTIFDFKSGTDKIDLSGFGLSGFDDIQGGIKRGFFGTEIDLGGGDELFLTGLFGVKVDADDFIF